jgi:hypothetical protein
MKKYLFVLAFMLCAQFISGQTEIEKTLWWQNFLERQSEVDLNIELSEFSQLLMDLEQQPISLDSNTIQKLFFLSEPEKLAIKRHLQLYGKLISIYELQSIEGISSELVIILSKVINIQPKQILEEPFIEWFKNGQHECLVQTEFSLQTPKGFKENQQGEKHYLGDRTRTLMRYRFSYKQQLYVGLAAEKDAGEQYERPDFLSVHLLYRGKGLIKTLAIGDYQAAFGLGLTFASRAPMGKSAQVFQTSGRVVGIQPYRSVSEFGFLRGAAIGLEIKKIKLDFLLSGLGDNGSGLHRTPKDMEGKNAMKNYVSCVHLSRTFSDGNIGLIYQMSAQQPHFSFRFEPNIRYGIYLKKNYKNILFDSEFSVYKSSYNLLLQVLKPLHSKVDYLILFRNYAANGQNFFAAAWSEFSGTYNERGIYQALFLKPNRKVQIGFFQDVFSAPAARYQKEIGAKGAEWLANAQIKSSKSLSWEIRLSYKKYKKDMKEDGFLLNNLWETKQQLRLQAISLPTKHLNIKARFDYNRWQNWDGSSFFLEASWQIPNHALSLTTRYLAFQSLKDETRIYAMEKDLPYQYALGSFNGVGSKSYLLVRYKISDLWDIYLKIGHLLQADGTQPGSGWDEISENALTDFSFQIRCRW